MWVLGVIAFYGFYRFTFVWYLTFWSFENPLQQPMHWRKPWFHATALLIAVTLLAASAYLFYASNHWLVFAPLLLLLFSFRFYFERQRRRTIQVIAKAAQIQACMEADGEPQPRINQRILAETTGEDRDAPSGPDWNLKSVVKYCVLSELGLYQPRADMNQLASGKHSISRSEQIDALLDFYYQESKKAFLANPKVPAPGGQNKAAAGHAPPSQIKNNHFAFQEKRHFTTGNDWQIPAGFGIHFNIATFQPEVGPEVILILRESRTFLTELRKQEPYQLRLNAGIVKTSAGPIVFLLWWFPPLIDGKPFAGYELLVSPKPGPSGTDLLKRAALQTHLHLVILDEHQEVFAVLEFDNAYGFGPLVAATEKIDPLPAGYDFVRAKEAFLREIPQDSLL